jgi:hypothetical protein
VLANGLSCHVHLTREFAERLTVLFEEQVEQTSAAGIGEGFEDLVHGS